MLAHCKQDLHLNNIVGIGVDPRTALCILPDHTAEIRGEGTATFLALTPQSKFTLDKGKPPTVTNLTYSQLSAGYTYDLTKREIITRPSTIALRGDPAPYRPPTSTGLSFDGDKVIPDEMVKFLNELPKDAWLTAGLVPRGNWLLHDVIPCNLGNPPEQLANQIAATQIGLVERPAQLAAWVPPLAAISVTMDATILTQSASRTPQSVLILNARHATRAGRGPEPRRAPVLESCSLHLIAPDNTYNIETDTVTVVPSSDPKP
jgi:hypothetical protein